jgi:hemophore-related protein
MTAASRSFGNLLTSASVDPVYPAAEAGSAGAEVVLARARGCKKVAFHAAQLHLANRHELQLLNCPTKEATIMLSARTAPRGVVAAIGIGAIATAMLCGCAAMAAADPPPAPPNCTAADLAGISSRVSAATSVYLFSHPDVNAFFTGLKGQTRSEISDDVQNYLNTNPQVQSDLQGIRQPLVDFRDQCSAPGPTPLVPSTGQ